MFCSCKKRLNNFLLGDYFQWWMDINLVLWSVFPAALKINCSVHRSERKCHQSNSACESEQFIIVSLINRKNIRYNQFCTWNWFMNQKQKLKTKQKWTKIDSERFVLSVKCKIKTQTSFYLNSIGCFLFSLTLVQWELLSVLSELMNFIIMLTQCRYQWTLCLSMRGRTWGPVWHFVLLISQQFILNA